MCRSCFLKYQLFIYLYLFGLFFLPACLFSQQTTWGFNLGAAQSDNIQGSNIDANGNVYVCGEYRGANVDFDPSAGTALHTSNGLADGFLVKYTSNGQYVLSLSIGGGGLDKINAIATDQAGNIYITGYFRGPNVDFDPSPATAFLTSNGESGGDPGYGGDIFVAKYSSTGQYQWAFNVGGVLLGDAGLAIKADAAGNIFIGGYFRTTIDFDPSGGIANLNASLGTAFLARYNTNGQYQWAFNFGQGDVDNSIFDMKLDGADNIYVTGYFQGVNIDFDPSPATALLSSAGNFEGFVAKYSSSGQYLFAFKIGGSGLDTGRGITVDNNGNIYVVGDFNGSNIDFDPSASSAMISSNGGSDVFIAKYTNTGQYVWAYNVGSAGNEIGWRIDTDNSSIFITGGLYSTADFDPSPAIDNLTSNGGADIFLAKYNLNGNYQCAFNIGSAGDDYGFSILVAGNDRFYLSGSFTGANVDFTPTQSTYLLNSNGSDDGFLVKYFWPPNTLPTGTLVGNTICSNGIGKLTFTSTNGTSPFTIVYNDGINSYTQSNVASGVPFNLQVNPIITTTYTATIIQDAVRCSPVNNAPGLTATIIVDNPPVKTNNDTTVCTNKPVQLNTSGAFTYSWTPALYLSNTAIPNPISTPAVSTQYFVTGTTVNGCIAKDTVNVNVFNAPTILVSNDTTICNNSSAQLFVSGGQTYIWSPANTVTNPSIANPIASPLSNTNYYVLITDINNCNYLDSVNVTIRPPAIFSISSSGNVCLNDTIRLSASGGNIYSWQPSSSLDNSNVANPLAKPLITTIYSVAITETTCNESANLSTTVSVLSLPIVQAIKSNDIDCSNDLSQLTGTGAQQYSWQPASTLNNAQISNPVARPVVTTDYIVKGTDGQGCFNYDTIRVLVTNINKGGYLMPSAFTPNNDGLNDCYGVSYWGVIENIEFGIYNRWGERVFYTTDPTRCWNGIYKGIPQKADVYVYIIKANTNCEKGIFRKGTLALIR